MANSGRNFSLTDHHQAFVDHQVALGRHASGSEVVREALRRYEADLQREAAHLAYLDRLAGQGEAAYARGEFTRVERDGVSALVHGAGRRGG